jgi:hypothetical protein
MYLNRILLLMLVLFSVASPIMTDWIEHGGTQWFRPHVLWLFVILITAVTIYRRRYEP